MTHAGTTQTSTGAGVLSDAGKINVLLVGGGGREHAIASRLARSPRLGSLYTTHPDNPGLSALAQPIGVPVNIREIYRVQQVMEKRRIGLVVIGPEDPLAEGFTDKLSAMPGVLVFGPSRAGAQLEADKAWAKQLMRSASIPTGEARVMTDAEAARQYFESRVAGDDTLSMLGQRAEAFRDPQERRAFINEQRRTDRDVARIYARPRTDLPVIKASGLAKGKGVVVPATLDEALHAIDEIMVRRVFGEAGAKVVIEEKLRGPEVSVLAVTDGRTIVLLPPAQDHKRLLDNDAGPNTGGMGAYSAPGILSDALLDVVSRDVLVPVIDAMRRDDIEYRGVIFAGLMLTHAGPKVLEFNCRFGDPECQTILARLESDLLEMLLACCTGTLDQADVRFSDRASCCVVLASAGYPDKPRAGDVITGLDAAAKVAGVEVFHAGTKRMPDGDIVTAGGRVLSVTAVGATAEQARDRAYEACAAIGFAGKQMRSDIGARALRGGSVIPS